MSGNANLLCLLETKSSGLAVSTLSTRGTLHSEAKGHRGHLGPMLAEPHLVPSQSRPRQSNTASLLAALAAAHSDDFS